MAFFLPFICVFTSNSKTGIVFVKHVQVLNEYIHEMPNKLCSKRYISQ